MGLDRHSLEQREQPRAIDDARGTADADDQARTGGLGRGAHFFLVTPAITRLISGSAADPALPSAALDHRQEDPACRSTSTSRRSKKSMHRSNATSMRKRT